MTDGNHHGPAGLWGQPEPRGRPITAPYLPHNRLTHLAGGGAPRAEPGAQHILGDPFGVEFGALLVGDGVDNTALQDVGEVPWGQRDKVGWRGDGTHRAP